MGRRDDRGVAAAGFELMAKLRESVKPDPPRAPAGAGERRLFRRRLRRCAECGVPSSWTLDGSGPLCGAHLARLGVVPPKSSPANGMAIVRVR